MEWKRILTKETAATQYIPFKRNNPKICLEIPTVKSFSLCKESTYSQDTQYPHTNECVQLPWGNKVITHSSRKEQKARTLLNLKIYDSVLFLIVNIFFSKSLRKKQSLKLWSSSRGKSCRTNSLHRKHYVHHPLAYTNKVLLKTLPLGTT